MGDHDVAVVGLGALGSAILYQFAQRGVRAVGLDRYGPPHVHGSTHGDTRITRVGIGEGAAYVPFVQASHRIWRQLEAETGQDLFSACGLLYVTTAREGDYHGKPDFLGTTVATARSAGIDHELMPAAAVGRRFPFMAGLGGSEVGYLEPGSGFVRPEHCVRAQLARAEALGAEIRTGVAVQAVRQEGGQVVLDTADGPLRAARAVVAAGAWTAPLLGPPFERLLGVTRQTLFWFGLDGSDSFREGGPAFIRIFGDAPEDVVYGFPPLPGEGAVKVGSEQVRVFTTPDAVDREVPSQEARAFWDRCVSGRLHGVTDELVRSATCLYTVTPDHDFIVDSHPAMDRVTVVSACSGHGFKHSAGLGEAVAGLVATGSPSHDLSPFRLARFG